MCCSMPSTTPGWRAALVLSARLPVACGSRDGLSPSHQFHFGANYRIQRPTLHLATFPQLHGSQLALGVEFPRSLFRLRAGCLVTPWLALPTSTRIWDG